MIRYYGAYTSHYKKYIPATKIEVEDENEESVNEWGEYESYRKSQINFGKSDPLKCPFCDKELVSLGVKYINKILFDDS